MFQFVQFNTKPSIKQKLKNTLNSLTIHSCKIHKTEDVFLTDTVITFLESNRFSPDLLILLGIHGHGRGLAHIGRLPTGLLLRHGTAYEGQRWSALNECVQGFLYAGVIKVDARRGGGVSLDRLSHWHASRWGHVALVSTSRLTRHYLARRVGGRGRSHQAVGLWLRGSGHGGGY